MLSDLLDRARLLVVTGKGGTGKTTVAGALAVAAARRGRRTLVLEVEGRQGLAALFGRPSLGYRETRLAEGVMGLAVDPEESLREYLGRYGAAPLARLLSWARLTNFVTAAAPGLGDILLVGKVWEAVTRRSGPRRVYDLVVVPAKAGAKLDEAAVGALLEEAHDRQRQITRERRLLKELRAKLEDDLP